ncbi:hypothetical protein C1645_841546 [Glomus cerebriforme]|uniref:Uncharacterized protein n=1 Tax=Glomus cerebriforme TaxID=658196 RepID=A0A397S8N3_9GLOM|nr:hypothetical protein C1645_841546 [Glomus cerebriforme]
MLDENLREYLRKIIINLHGKKEFNYLDIIYALLRIHDENAICILEIYYIHQDLIIAPEVIAGKQTTFKSDVYSIAIFM